MRRNPQEREPESDGTLMRRVRDNDDPAAFAELTLRYRAPLVRFFRAVLPVANPAEDFAQETLLRLWLARKRWEPTGEFSAYVFQIARHYFLNQRVRLRVQAAEPPFEGQRLEIHAVPNTQPELVVLERLEAERQMRRVATLPQHLRDVVILSRIEGLPYVQVATRLGIPVGTVKSRMAEAVRRLRDTREDIDNG